MKNYPSCYELITILNIISADALISPQCRLLINFANSLDPDQAVKMSGLIWIQTI